MASGRKPTELTQPEAPGRGELTRARLVETAYILFCQKGFHGTSLRDIAEAADVAVGGIYNHFKDKDDIFAAVLDTYHPYHTLVPAVQAIESDTVEGFLRAVMHLISESVLGAQSRVMPLLFIELVEFQGCHLGQLFERLAPTILGFVNSLSQREGRLRSIAPKVLFRTFMSLLMGYFVSEMLFKDSPVFKQKINWLDGLLDIFLHGILEPEA
jgi:AcrR family transcriptional regulator